MEPPTERFARLVEPVTERLVRLDPGALPQADPACEAVAAAQRRPRAVPDAAVTQRHARDEWAEGSERPVPDLRVVEPATPAVVDEPADDPLRRRQIGHDIHHEIGTIMMLASLLSSAPDVGPDSRERARQILGESRWLDQLHRAYDATMPGSTETGAAGGGPVRLDELAGEVVAAVRLSTVTQVTLAADAAWARVDRLAYWRAVRNLVGNAVRAAGPRGRVDVRVSTQDGWVVSEVDDDGPGFGAAPPGFGSLGLGIVQDTAAAWGGELEIGRGARGGCRARLKLPVAPPGHGRSR